MSDSNQTNSGLKWPDPIPSNWEVLRLKRVVSLRNEPIEDIPENSHCFQIKGDNSDLSSKSLFRVYPGDILYSKFSSNNSKPIIIEKEGVCTSDFLVLKPISIDSLWLYYYLLTTKITQQLERAPTGSKKSKITWSQLKTLPILVPPFLEQLAITSFLTAETKKLDDRIIQYVKFIGLLKEKRQTLINQAITKGRNPEILLRESGVTGLELIPQHWQLVPINAVATCNDDILPQSTDSDVSIEYVSLSDVCPKTGQIKPREFSFGDAPSRARLQVKPDDILLSLVGSASRSPAFVENPSANLVASTGFAVLRAHSIQPKFLFYVLKTNYLNFGLDLSSVGSVHPALKTKDLMRFKIPLPPITEQLVIVEFLDKETSKIDQLIEKLNQNVELLKEKQDSFVSEAITGKLKVPEFTGFTTI